jgi:hypothetical protein
LTSGFEREEAMHTEVMIKGDWWKAVKESVQPKYVEWDDPQSVEVEVEFPDELYAKLKKDPLLLQKLSDGGSEVYKAFVKECAGFTQWADDETEKAALVFGKDKNVQSLQQKMRAIDKGFAARIQKAVDNAPTAIEKGVMDAWAKVKTTRKDYRDYKIRAGAKIGLKVGSIALSIATLVGSHGANPFAWRTLIKDTIKTIDELVTLALEAESVRKRAEGTVNRVLSWHAMLGQGKAAAASEIGLGLLKVFIGTDVYMTYDAAAGDVKAYKSKLGGLDAKSHEAAQKLQKLLLEMHASRTGGTAEIGTEVEAMEKDVARLINKVIALQEEIKGGTVWADNMGKLLAELLKAQGLTELGRILKAVETVSEIALSTQGWVQFAGDAGKLAIGILKDAVTVGKNIDRWMDDVKKAMG